MFFSLVLNAVVIAAAFCLSFGCGGVGAARLKVHTLQTVEVQPKLELAAVQDSPVSVVDNR